MVSKNLFDRRIHNERSQDWGNRADFGRRPGGSFSYTKETHEAKLGPIELSVKDKQTVNTPVWAGVGAIGVGGVLILFGSKKG